MSIPRKKRRGRISVVKPETDEPTSDSEQLMQEVKKYVKLVPFEPEPNLGRVYEIKEELKKGTYPTREMIEEAAQQLALRWARKEGNSEGFQDFS